MKAKVMRVARMAAFAIIVAVITYISMGNIVVGSDGMWCYHMRDVMLCNE
jgi:hypothetical protein